MVSGNGHNLWVIGDCPPMRVKAIELGANSKMGTKFKTAVMMDGTRVTPFIGKEGRLILRIKRDGVAPRFVWVYEMIESRERLLG